jgi:hypothetical protein
VKSQLSVLGNHTREGDATTLNIFEMREQQKTGERRSCGALWAAIGRPQTWDVWRLHRKRSAGASFSRHLFLLVKMELEMFTAVASLARLWLLFDLLYSVM